MTKEDTKKATKVKAESLNIHQRIHAIMCDVQYVQKEDNKVNNQYHYVSHDAVTKLIAQAMRDHRVVNEIKILETDQQGNRTECSMEVAFINIDKPEERHVCTSFGYGVDQQDKGPGKAMSYAYKFALLKTFGLETGEDAERDSTDHTEEDPQKEKISPGSGSARAQGFASSGDRNDKYEELIKKISEYTVLEQLINYKEETKELCRKIWKSDKELGMTLAEAFDNKLKELGQ